MPSEAEALHLEDEVITYRNDHDFLALEALNRAFQNDSIRGVLWKQESQSSPPELIQSLAQLTTHNVSLATAMPLSSQVASYFGPPQNPLDVSYAPLPLGTCIYIPKTTWQLLGPLAQDYHSLHYSLLDFGCKAVAHNLRHGLLPSLWFPLDLSTLPQNPLLLLNGSPQDTDQLLQRYPFAKDWVENEQQRAFQSVKASLRIQQRPLQIALDGRMLRGAFTGTQRYIIELLTHLMEQETNAHFSLIIVKGMEAQVEACFPKHFERLQLVTESQLSHRIGRRHWDILHRPYQAFPWELAALKPYAKRVVVSFFDLIAYENPSYYSKHRDYEHYCQQASKFLQSADGVITISQHVRQELKQQFQLEDHRIKVTYLGVDSSASNIEAPERPKALPSDTQDFFFYIGTDFPHKNLEGTLRFYEYLLQQEALPHHLVIVGPSADFGNRKQLQAELEKFPELQQRVCFIDNVTESELQWLYQQASMLWYLSLSEGFGLPPLEAFKAGCPVLASQLTSIPEVLGETIPTFHPGEFGRMADFCLRLLQDDAARLQLVKAGQERACQFLWSRTAQETLDFYSKVLTQPPRPSIHWQWQLPHRIITISSTTQVHG